MRDERDDKRSDNRRNDGIGISFWANLPISAKALSLAAIFGGGASVSGHVLDFLPGHPGSQDCAVETAGYSAELDKLRGRLAVQARELQRARDDRSRLENDVFALENWAKETLASLPEVQRKQAQIDAPAELLEEIFREGYQ